MELPSWQQLGFSVSYNSSMWCVEKYDLTTKFWSTTKSNGNSISHLMRYFLLQLVKEVIAGWYACIIPLLLFLESSWNAFYFVNSD